MNQNHQKGKLKRWNDDKGFGFIASDSGKDIFIHVSGFKGMGRRPRVGDVITYQIHAGNDGKERAVNAKIGGVTETRSRPTGKNIRKRNSKNWLSAVISVVFIIAIGLLAYNKLTAFKPFHEGSAASVRPGAEREIHGTNYSCEGKVFCSEMTSCEEAKFYLRNCPGTKMDGDGDGVPCESQWCNW